MRARIHTYMTAPLIITFLGGLLVFILASKVDVLENIYHFTRVHEDLELDEIIPVIIYFWLAFGVLSSLWAYRLLRAKRELAQTNESLKEAMSKIKTLEGLLPICANCKKIRIDDSSWQQLETYISQHSDAKFSHSICPDCAKELYPELSLGRKK